MESHSESLYVLLFPITNPITNFWGYGIGAACEWAEETQVVMLWLKAKMDGN